MITTCLNVVSFSFIKNENYERQEKSDIDTQKYI